MSPIAATFAWPLGVRAVADCKAHVEPAPDPACRCGIYAKVARGELTVPPGNPSVTVVVGQVSLWGTLLEHERGWKAQYAYPYALFVQAEDGTLDTYDAVAKRLATAYQVDAEVEWSHEHRQAHRAPAHRDRSRQ